MGELGTVEYIRRDRIVEYRPLPVFVSDQIGGLLAEVSSGYVLIPGDPSRETFAE